MSRTQSSFADRVSENMLSGQWSTPNPNPTRGSLRSLLTTWPLIYSNMLVYKYNSAATQVLVPHSILCAEDYRKEIVWNNRFIRIDGKSISLFQVMVHRGIWVQDLVHSHNRFLTYKDFTDKLSIRTTFFRLRRCNRGHSKNLERIAGSWRILFCN